VIAAFTAVGLLRFTYLFLDDVSRGVSGTLLRRVLEESTGAYSAMLLFAAVFLVERRFPLSDGRWRWNWPVHLGALATYSVVHSTLMWVSRVALAPLFAGTAYDSGRVPVRYLMELPNDVLAYCGFVGVLTFLRVQRALREREANVATLARDAAEARLEAMSARIQPHFLFNALNTISAAVPQNPAAAEEMIGRLGDLLRRALRASDQPEFALSDEVEILKSYLAIISTRSGERVEVDLRVDPSALSVAVPAFLLQPLVENAVRHGRYEHASAIVVQVDRREGDVFITIENEMSGVERGDPILGTGLASTQDRLRLLYGDSYAFSAGADGDRFKVAIRIPARTTRALPRISDPALHVGAHH